MTIYIDLIFFINFFYDFLLLLTVGAILKRKRKLSFYFISALFGASIIFLLLLNINTHIFFFIKILVSILMCLIAFGYISFRYSLNNVIYLYMCSIILAGFLYFLDTTFSYDHKGLVFFFNGISVNVILLMIISPFILIFYHKCTKKLSTSYNLYYNIQIYFNDLHLNCLAYFDSGNNLIDPVSKKGIIIVSSKLLNKIHNIRDPIYVPFNTINGSNIMKCFKPSYIIINNKKIYNYLIGESNYHFSDGVTCLLNNKLMEDNYV